MGEAFPMKGGDGLYSYAKNSKYQKLGSDSVKAMIQEAVIDKLDLSISISTAVSIADLGCSVGPNTFFTVQNLIQAVENKYSLQGLHSQKLEFQVFFNDHSANDFNTLLASLPLQRQYHAAAVPGSFHGRLFPRASITMAYSSFALQWLSKPPQGLVLNEGRIHTKNAPDDVVRAYSEQFERDLGGFMSARAEEIVSGGLMFLIVPATPDGELSHSSDLHVLFDFLGRSLMDLANEGVVEKSAVDAFNLPIHIPRAGEMRKVIESNGCFSIETMELTIPRSGIDDYDDDDEGTDVVGIALMHLRAGMEGVFTAHFGASVVDKMFFNMSQKAQQISRCYKNHLPQLFLVLKRN